jgi:hypothetical protein
MTREEVLELTLQVIKGKMWWATNIELILEVAFAAAEHERKAFPDLCPVIAWLENGCDPKEAAKELRLYAEAIEARGEA